MIKKTKFSLDKLDGMPFKRGFNADTVFGDLDEDGIAVMDSIEKAFSKNHMHAEYSYEDSYDFPLYIFEYGISTPDSETADAIDAEFADSQYTNVIIPEVDKYGDGTIRAEKISSRMLSVTLKLPGEVIWRVMRQNKDWAAKNPKKAFVTIVTRILRSLTDPETFLDAID